MPILPVAALALLATTAQDAFVNFEGPQTHPIRISADGTRLFTVLTPDARLCVWSLADPDHPVLLDEIPVGAEPVSVTPRTVDEVWVVDWLSDSVSVVSLSARKVIDVLPVKDEPSDVVFAGGKAFVSAAASDAVHVFDAETRAPLGVIPISGKDPRALAVSPDGTEVYALIQRSGNRTSVIPKFFAPPQPAPTNPALPAPPKVSLIISGDDPAWDTYMAYELDDYDLARIDVATESVVGYVPSIGTINQDLAVHPDTGAIYVVNTDARNTVRFEPNLRGHAIDSRVTRITLEPATAVEAFDLNPSIDYGVLPNAAALGVALSEPTAVVAGADQLYVAAQGTDRIGVLSLDGQVLDRIEVGDTPGAAVDTRGKRGPRGLALHANAERLYVLNRLSQTISVIDTAARAVVRELSNGTHDPTPEAIATGRRFLYDAKLSGNGTLSCAACHWDAETDVLAWDLGDPGGELGTIPEHPDPVIDGYFDAQYLHPMKGPMLTLTLRGIAENGPLHWRGDMPGFADFNSVFDTTMGGVELPPDDMAVFAEYGYSIAFPPNPNQPLDGGYTAAQAVGLDLFTNNLVEEIIPGHVTCNDCHTVPSGTSGIVLPTPKGPMRPAPLRTMYRREGFNEYPEGEHKSGYGVQHDGDASVWDHFTADVFQIPETEWDEFLEFMLAFDTGTPPATGYRVVLDETTAMTAAMAEVAVLESLAAAGVIDLVAQGNLDGVRRGLVFDAGSGTYLPDSNGLPTHTFSQLEFAAAHGAGSLVFTGVPVGAGVRAGIDRDEDGVLDADAMGESYGSATAGCGGEPTIRANSEAFAGNAEFAVVGTAGSGSIGALVLGLTDVELSVLGVDLFVAPDLVVSVGADASGVAAVKVPLGETLAPGVSVHAQFVWADPCGPQGFSASAALRTQVLAP